VPTNFIGPWDHNRGLQVDKEVKAKLGREKRFVGLLVAGIIAAIAAIAAVATTAVALSQSIQKAHYVNTLPKM
jgi:hypothetical protein